MMRLSLRSRIVLTLVPLLVLLAFLGAAGAVLLYRLGGSINAILRENYRSVIAMQRINEALERIDSSFQFALAGKEEEAHEQFETNWPSYLDALEVEQNNITLPGEKELVDELTTLTRHYHQQGAEFYKLPAGDARRNSLYFGDGKRKGLLQAFKKIKEVSGEILAINQKNMEDASGESRTLAANSLFGFGVGLAAVVVLAGLLAINTVRSILMPIQTITQSALAIGAGNLDQVVPVMSRDELGRLAEAFNVMARQLRHYRQTDYARLLRAQQTSQATIDSFPDPVLVVDSEGHVEMSNPAARRLLCVPIEENGKPSTLAWQPPEPLRQAMTEALRDQRPYLPEGFDHVVPLHAGSQDHFYLPRILPIRDPYGGTLGAAVLLQDVTRFRLLDQIKSDLVATVSHELKTPLTGVRLALHLLLEETVGPLTPKQMELLLDARDNAERLLARVNNLLDLARLEQKSDRLEVGPQDAHALLEAAAESARPRAEDKGLSLVVEVPPDLPPVAADAPRLAHALDNLLDNAVTYTDRGGRISLSASAVDGTVTLAVADTGRGIPPEYVGHVFDKFFRVPGQSEGSGTGLGLAIVREIVAAHGGTVSCESRPGEGSVFRLRLPVWEGPSEKG
jgi:NtrC-family two-component system sensor histidine kinase KinB